jgi:hypothetical protein
MRGITDTAKKSGFTVVLINTDEDTAAEVDAVRVLLDKRVEGLIVAPASSVERNIYAAFTNPVARWCFWTAQHPEWTWIPWRSKWKEFPTNPPTT